MRFLFFICCFSSLLIHGCQEDYQLMQDGPMDVKKYNQSHKVHESCKIVDKPLIENDLKASLYKKEVSEADEQKKPMILWGNVLQISRIMRAMRSDRKF